MKGLAYLILISLTLFGNIFGFSAPPAIVFGGTDPFGPRLESFDEISLVHPRRLHLRIRAQAVENLPSIPLVLGPGEQITEPDFFFVDSNGADSLVFTGALGSGPFTGAVVGSNGQQRKPFDVIHGTPLNLTWADLPSSYSLSSSTNSNFSSPQMPISVRRKTIMCQSAYTGAIWNSGFPANSSGAAATLGFTSSHFITLEFANPVSFGSQLYTLNFNGAESDDTLGGRFVNLNFDNELLVQSEAIHVNQIGYLPSAPKYAYLSFWDGVSGIALYDDVQPLTYQVVRLDNGQVVDSGMVTLRLDGTATENLFLNGNLQLADVYQVDMTNLTEPTDVELALVIDGIGRSMPFRIGLNVYAVPLQTVMRVMYYQRNGVALQDEFRGYSFTRGRTLHPDDVTLLWTDTTLASTGNSDIPDQLHPQGFPQIAQGRTNISCTSVGGWMDAGDWDTRAPHMQMARWMLMLLERFPFYETFELSVPGESGNSLPDLLEQAMWDIDYYESLQQPDGGVSGGVEALSHPRYGDRSDGNNQPWFCYSPDPWTTFQFASSAAYAAFLYQDYDVARSQQLRDAALLAFDYAEAHLADPQAGPPAFQVRYQNVLADERGKAAVYLLKLLGPNATLTSVFEQTERCTSSLLGGASENGAEAAAIFALLPAATAGNATLQSACRSALLVARTLIDFDDTAFRTGLASFLPPAQMTAGALLPFLIYALMVDTPGAAFESQLSSIGVAQDFTWGNNPLNTVLVTDGRVPGLFNHTRGNDAALRTDSWWFPEAAPPGITLFGPIGGDFATLNVPITALDLAIPPNPTPALFPSPDANYATMEYFTQWVLMGEYTPHSTLGIELLTLGYWIGVQQERGLATIDVSLASTTTTSSTTMMTSGAAAAAGTPLSFFFGLIAVLQFFMMI